MRVKRYVVNALPEAVSLIRTDLGSDAVILETKEIKVGGFMGMFRKKKMEVTAAVESAAAKPQERAQRLAQPEVSAMVEQILQTAQRTGAATATLEQPLRQQAMPAAAAAYQDQRGSYQAAADIAPKPQPSNHEVPNMDRRMEKEQFIINEIRDLREYMLKLTKDRQAIESMSDSLVALKERLNVQEVDPVWSEKLLETLMEAEKS
ncbi:MAG: GTP-binding signal recognition particle G-domain protein, partial [Paenibacillus sp.]|nr:GTP-binding signal recognition particle G-domain protein [Paenibacillus sp.]